MLSSTNVYNINLVKSPESNIYRIIQLGVGISVCIVLNDVMTLILARAGILLPGSVAGLVVLLIVLLITPGDRLAQFFKPAADLLLLWLPLLFVPALVDFPLVLSEIPAWDFPKIIVILTIGILFTSAIGGWSLITIGYLHFKITGQKQAMIFPEQEHVLRPKKAILGRRTLWIVVLVSSILTAMYSLLPRSRPVLLLIVMLLMMPATYAVGQYLQRSYPNGYYPNPILTSGALSICMVYVLSVLSNTSPLDLLTRVHSGGSMNMFTGYSFSIGAGDVYLYLLNASVVSMALPVYGQKYALLIHGVDMLLASILVAASSILFTIGLCNMTFVSKSIARSMALRTVTAPIAMASITYIQGLSGVAGAVSVITGVAGGIFWRKLVDLKFNKFASPLTRGFSIGSSCHGMGTAILSLEEPESTPSSTIAFIAVGVASSSLISIPGFRNVIEMMV